MPLQAAISYMSLCSSGVQRNVIVLLRLRALFPHGILLTPPSPRRARLPSRPASWEQARVAVGDVYRLVANEPGDGQRGEAHLDRQAHVAVAYVVYADALHARSLAPSLHLVGQEVLGHGE